MFLMVRRRSDETDRQWRTPPSNSAAEEDRGVSACASGPFQATVGRWGGSGVHTVMRKGYFEGMSVTVLLHCIKFKGRGSIVEHQAAANGLDQDADMRSEGHKAKQILCPSFFFIPLIYSILSNQVLSSLWVQLA